jgi:hypothetical protein
MNQGREHLRQSRKGQQPGEAVSAGEGQGRPHCRDSPKRLSDTLKAHDMRHEYHETEGGHTWIGGGIACKEIRN